MRVLLLICLAACGESHTHDSDVAVPLNESREAESSGGTWSVTYTPTPDPIPQSDPFTLDVRIEGVEPPPVVEFAAIMPEHNHGMNTDPLVTPAGEAGQYTVSSLLFHMPGHWRMTLSLGEGGDAENAVFDVICCP